MASSEKSAMGAFVIGGFLLFAVGLFLIGDRRMLFSDSAEYYSEFAQVSSLEVGAMVRVAGMNAGEVLEVQVPTAPEGKFRVKFSIVEKLHPIVRTDSVASLQTDGLAGKQIPPGQFGSNLSGTAPKGSTLPAKEPFEIGDLLTQIRQTVSSIDMTVGEVKGDVTDATQTVAETAKHVDQIIVGAQDDVKRITLAASRITEDAGVIIAAREERRRYHRQTLQRRFDLQQPDEFNDGNPCGSRESPRQTSSDVQQLVARFKSGEIPGNLEEIIKNVRDSSERLKVMVSSLQPGLRAAKVSPATCALLSRAPARPCRILPKTRRRSNAVSSSADSSRIEVSTIWTGFHSPSTSPRNSTRTFKRNAPGFSKPICSRSSRMASEELSDQGRKKLDAAMADFLRFTRDSAVIVEGYAGSGSSDEQFLRSRERAVKVREYLLKRFSLSAEYVGVMPMGAVRSSSPQGAVHDGVALVLLKN